MGTVILADVTELTTIKISELDEAASMDDSAVMPIVQASITKNIQKENAYKDIPINGGNF